MSRHNAYYSASTRHDVGSQPSACLGAGHAINPLDGDHVIVDDVHDPVRADPQPVIPASVESLCGVWIIGQGGDSCADSTHAVLVSHVTAR